MTLKEIVESGLIKDDTYIRIAKPITGDIHDLREGNWFHDKILEYLDEEITSLTWSEGPGLFLTLK